MFDLTTLQITLTTIACGMAIVNLALVLRIALTHRAMIREARHGIR